MGNCPNPNCNGTLKVEEDYEWEYFIICDTCRFTTSGGGGAFRAEVEKAHEEALQRITKWIDEHGLPQDIIRNWEEWEKRR